MGVGNSSEKEILGRFLTGSEVGFEELVTRYESKIYSLCLNLTRNEADSEAVLSDVFCKALDELHTVCESNISLSNYLYRTTIELASEKDAVAHPELESSSHSRMMQVVSAALEDHYDESGDDEGLLRAAIHNLPYEYRAVYLLHEAMGVEMNDVMEILQVSELEARAFLHRARLMVCRYLQRFRGARTVVANLGSRTARRPATRVLI
ncbi:MAG: hypothetical protein U0136_01595 [Bdellovibrionota bacterium]